MVTKYPDALKSLPVLTNSSLLVRRTVPLDKFMPAKYKNHAQLKLINENNASCERDLKKKSIN